MQSTLRLDAGGLCVSGDPALKLRPAKRRRTMPTFTSNWRLCYYFPGQCCALAHALRPRTYVLTVCSGLPLHIANEVNHFLRSQDLRSRRYWNEVMIENKSRYSMLGFLYYIKIYNLVREAIGQMPDAVLTAIVDYAFPTKVGWSSVRPA